MSEKNLYTGSIFKTKRNVYDEMLEQKEKPKSNIDSGIYTGSIFKDQQPSREISGAAYLGGSLAVGLASPFEGITDLVTATAAWITGDKDYAEYVYKNNVTGGWQNALDDKYQPSDAMKTAGEIVGGVGQTLSYAAMSALTVGLGSAVAGGSAAASATVSAATKVGQFAAAYSPIFLSSFGAYTGEAVQTTGELGGKEVLYGFKQAVKETALEQLSAVGGIIGRMTGNAGIMDKAFAKVIKNTTLRGIISDASGEFVEEALSELITPAIKRSTGIDPEASTSAQAVLRAGLMGMASGAIVGGLEAGTATAIHTNTGKRIQKKGTAESTVKTARLLVDSVGKLTYEGVKQDILDLKASVESYEKSPSALTLGKIASQMYFIETKSVVNAEKAKVLATLNEDTVAKVNALVPKPNGTWTMEDIRNNEGNIATIYATAVYANKLGQMTGDNSTTAQAIESTVTNDLAQVETDMETTVKSINGLSDGGFVAYKMPIGTSVVVKTKDGYRVGVYPDRASSNAEWSGITYKTAKEAYDAMKLMNKVSTQETKKTPTTEAVESEKEERKPNPKHVPPPKKPTRKQIKKAKQQAKKEAKLSEQKAKLAEQKAKEEAAKAEETKEAEQEKPQEEKPQDGSPFDRKYTKEDMKLCREMVDDFDFLPVELQDRLLNTARTGRQSKATEQQIKEAIAFSYQAKTTIAFSNAIKADGFFTSVDGDYLIVVHPKDSRTATVIHEMAHRMKKTGGWDALAKYVRKVVGEEKFNAIRENYKKSYDDWRAEMEKGGTVVPELSEEQLDEEAVADALAYYLKKVPYLENKASKGFIKKAFASIKSIVDSLKNQDFATYRTAVRIQRAYEKMLTVVEQDQAVRQFAKAMGEVEKRYSFSSISQSFFEKEVTAEEMESGSYKDTKGYKEYVEKCLNNMRQSVEDFNEAEARKEIEDSIDGIVKVAVAMKKAGYDILDDAKQRDVKDSKQRLLFSSLEPNSDYFTSSDISTICDKRKNFTEIYEEIVRREEKLGVPREKRFFANVDNYFVIHKIMADKGLTQPCEQCYVESMRKNLGRMANAFLQLVQETDPNNKSNAQLYQVSGKNKGEVKSNNFKLRENLLKTIEEQGYDITADKLTVEMLTTGYGLAELKLRAPLIYEAFNSFYGQSKPKLPKEAVPFRFGELTALLTDHNGNINKGMLKQITSTGGFRLQSYSDFQIQNFVDVLQVIFEAGTLGLNGHAYTKVPAFLDATKNTNLKRNISIFMYNDGGEWKIDRNDSFPYTLEAIYDIVKNDESGNTSIIAVSQNEMMSAWVMANDNIGYFIPFHKSGMKMGTVRETVVREGKREILGYAGIKDHTRQQTEVWAKTTADHKALTKVKKGINIYEFWDFSNAENLSQKELIEKNIKKYIDACEKAGYLPKFREYVMNNDKVLKAVLSYSKKLGFSSQDATIDDISFEYKGYRIPYGYYKCLGDFGMFKPNGEASPIERLSLKDYDFDGAIEFFSKADSLRRTEVLQQISNGDERQRYISGDKKNLTTAEIEQEIQAKRKQVADEIVPDTDTRYSPSSSRDTTYLEAVNRGDMETVQRMVDETAEKAMHESKIRGKDGKLIVCLHATDAKFTVFDTEKIGSGNGGANFGKGFYFTAYRSYAKDYGSSVGEYFLDIRNPFEYYSTSKQYLVDMLGKSGHKYDKDFVEQYDEEDLWDDDLLDGFLAGALIDENPYSVFSEMLQNAGFDGINISDGEEIVAFYPEQIKSADPITYDDNGDIIPLSKRFDASNPDIRYSPQQSASSPDPNNPYDHVDTTMPKKEKLTRAEARLALKEFFESAQIELTNQQAGIENFLVRVGRMKKAEAAAYVQAVRTSEAYGIGAVTTGQYSADGKRVGEGLFQILSPLWDEKNETWDEKLFHEFSVYITNLHNIDRQREDKPVISYTTEEITEKVNKLKSKMKDSLLQAEAEGKSEKVMAEIEAEYTKKIRDVERPYAIEMSQKAVKQYERQHPEFREIADKLSAFNRNLNQYRVDTGLLSQEVADELNKKYPYYVPTYRVEDGMVIGTGSLKGRYNFEVQQSVKTAKGSDKVVDNPLLTYIHQTISTYKAGRVNELMRLVHDNADGVYVVTQESTKPKTELEADDETGSTEYAQAIDRTNNELTYYQNGKKVSMKVYKNIFAGFEGFTTSNTSAISSMIIQGFAKVNNLSKSAVTSWNPFFLASNFFKDTGDALFYSKFGAKKWAAARIRAQAMIHKNDPLWQEYISMGGLQSSIYEFERGFSGNMDDRGMLRRAQMHKDLKQKVDNLNIIVEQASRFAEYILSREAGLSVQESMLNAADVTINFSRGGRLVKMLNKTIMPFLNPAVQGMSKMERTFFEDRTIKDILSLVLKCVALGILPMVLANIMYGDDEEYDDLQDTVKENNYLFKIGDTWIKIPKGRVQAVLSGAYNRTERAVTGKTVDFMDYLSNVASQATPLSNISRTLFSPFKDVQTNTTWYGGSIENQSDELKAPSERYDEYTSELSKTIGRIFNYSPKKLDYLIDQSTGVIGDILLPATTSNSNIFEALGKMATQRFVVNEATSSRLSSEFYDIYEKNTYKKTAGDEEAWYINKFLTEYKDATSDLYDQMSEIQADESLSTADKNAQSKALRVLINQTYKSAMQDLETYKSALSAAMGVNGTFEVVEITKENRRQYDCDKDDVGRYAVLYDDRKYRLYDTKEDADKYVTSIGRKMTYAESIRLVYGAERAIKAYNGDLYTKAIALNSLGIGYEIYYNAYFGTQAMDKEQTEQYIASLGLKKSQRAVLMYALGYTAYKEQAKKEIKDKSIQEALNLK